MNSFALALCGLALAACGGDDSGTGASGDGSTTAGDSSSSAGTTTSPTTGSTGEDETTSGGSQDGSTTDVGTSSSTTDPTTGPAPVCGDGNVDPGEACDDGNDDDADACTNACTDAACGDAIVQPGAEECDDGNQDDTDTCTNACKNAACGDGIVGPGEACDDGNDVDADECTNACASASCGDGVVGPGEECDDANQVDTDACLNTCLAAVCGDTVVQDGVEACDDGNDVDTDACLPGCVAAKCGDAVVQDGVEQCDDGNMENADACSNACVQATCSDNAKNAGETDVDCGGPACPKCGLGLACGGNADCGVGVCLQNKCVSNKSCKALFDADGTLGDGKYTLDPDEAGPGQPFEAFCDMTHDGGGWTLIMKSIGTNFHYDDALWENEMTLNPTNFDFVAPNTRAKYQTFTTVGFQALRTTSNTDFGVSFTHNLPAPVASARALFQGPGVEVSKTTLNAYFNGISLAFDKHSNFCNPSAKYVNFGINLKKLNGVGALPDGGFCDWNGGARFGQRVNADHGATGNHAGQGWGTYTTIAINGMPMYVANISQLLWVR